MENENPPPENFSPLWEESYWDTTEGREESRQLQLIIQEELDAQDPVLTTLHGVVFESRSKGLGKRNKKGERKRKRRKHPKSVTLLKWNGRWHIWTGEDRSDNGRIPWDEWVQEIFDEHAVVPIFVCSNPLNF